MKSLFSALLMYSRIPAPMVEWKEENRRYSLCFFPAIGAVILMFLVLWRYICSFLNTGQFLFAAGAVFIPFAVTGGIHLDGFCDVHDALASCAGKEKSLEIMKDSRTGAFAVLHAVMYFVLLTALFSEVTLVKTSLVCGTGFVLSRALSGLCAVTLKAAKKDGSLQDFTNPADRKVTVSVLTAVALLCLIFIGILSWQTAVLSTAAVLFSVWNFRRVCYKRFGGITGDCSGWFLQNTELYLTAAAVFAQKITEVIS